MTTIRHDDDDFTYSIRVWKEKAGGWQATIHDGMGQKLREGSSSDLSSMTDQVLHAISQLMLCHGL